MDREYGDMCAGIAMDNRRGAMLGGAANQICPPKPTETQAANGEIGGLRETILETRAVLSELNDRLLGAAPEGPCGTSTKPCFGGGSLGELRANIDAARDNAFDVLALARRLSENV